MGKHVIEAVDGPGFIVNRCNRPFGLEALRLLAEQVASVPEIDRAVRMGGGFRMGPFEVMDLVGVDVGLDVSRSFYEQSFGEPRWQPSPIAVRTVAAGRLGRKTGPRLLRLSAGRRATAPTTPSLRLREAETAWWSSPVTRCSPHELREAAGQAGWAVADPVEAEELASPFLILDLTGDAEPDAPLQGAPQAICLASGSLAGLDPGGSAVGFHALPPLTGSRLVELSRGADSSESAAQRAERFFTTLGKHVQWVGDAPGLILGRMICQVINEAAFALGEGYGSAQDIDAGMKHGLNYPRGILAWADEIGLDHVLSVLDALYLERGEERYRAAPELRRLAWSGRLGRQTGAGFFDYDPE